MLKTAHAAAPAFRPEPPPTDAPAVDEADHLAAAVARVEHRLRLLDELAEMAMKMARRVTAAALAEDAAMSTDGATANDNTKATTAEFAADDLAKLSRAVRLTLDLAGRLEETLRRLRAGEIAARAISREDGEFRAARARHVRDTAARDKVSEQVAMVIFSESESERECDDLLDALDERLTRDIVYMNAEEKPLREMVEGLCADLGLKPDWSRWTDEGWPEPDSDIFGARAPWSPFNQISRKPLLSFG